MHEEDHSKHTGSEHDIASLKIQTEQLKEEVATLKNLVRSDDNAVVITFIMSDNDDIYDEGYALRIA